MWMGSLLIPRSNRNFNAPDVETIHDANQLNAAKPRYAKSLGAELFVQGTFAAIPNGIWHYSRGR